MADPANVKIGFVTPISSSSPHFEPFRTFIPKEVEMDFEGLGIVRGSLDSLAGTGDMVVETSARLARERGWKGVIVSGAPVEVLNPGLLARLKDAVDVPVTTALESCVEALKSLSTPKVLLLTPFVESMNKLIRDYLTACGIEAISPADTFDDYRDAMTRRARGRVRTHGEGTQGEPGGGCDLLPGRGAGPAEGLGADRAGPLAAGGRQQSRHALVHARERRVFHAAFPATGDCYGIGLTSRAESPNFVTAFIARRRGEWRRPGWRLRSRVESSPAPTEGSETHHPQRKSTSSMAPPRVCPRTRRVSPSTRRSPL